MYKFIFSIFFSFSCFLLCAQQEYVYVNSIDITGNKKTRKSIILRELNFQPGDSILMTQLQERLAFNKQQLMNTSLFLDVNINIPDWDTEKNELGLLIDVQEAWYIYPIPVFELVDRNFNVWWVEENRSLKRVNWGLKFYWLNFTGRRDVLKLATEFGYSQKYEVKYNLPALNKNQTMGLEFNTLFTRAREIGYKSLENKIEFNRSENEYMLRRFRLRLGLSYRPKFYHKHLVKVAFHRNQVSDMVAQDLNPDYLGDGRIIQRYLSFDYEFTDDHRDIRAYPLNGYFLEGKLRKEGLGIYDDVNRLLLSLKYAKYFSLSKKISLELIAKGQSDVINEQQAYYNSRALGYDEDYLRGYEYYVIDGSAFAFFKSSIRYQIWNRDINWGRLMPLKSFKRMPLKVYFKLNGDTGYVMDKWYNEQNPMTNRMLWGGGVALDFVVYNDKVVQFEYSFNHLMEKGLFLHFKLSF